MFNVLVKLLKNLFTTNNGEDLSFAKITGAFGFGAIVLMVTVGVPMAVIFGPKLGLIVPPLAEWSSYYTGASVLIAAAYAGLTGLIWGSHKTEEGTGNG